MFKYFILNSNGYIICKVTSSREKDDPSYVEVIDEVFDSVVDFKSGDVLILKYADGVVVKDISAIDYVPLISEFNSYAGGQLRSQFINLFDGDLRQHEEELKLVALGDMQSGDMAMDDTEYNSVIGQKMIIRRAVKQLKAYAADLTKSILLLRNIDLSRSLETGNPSKSLEEVSVVYSPVDLTPSLSGTTLTLDGTNYIDIVKGDFFFICDANIIRVNVFSDTAITDLSSYGSVELWGWVGIDSVKYAVEV